MPVPSRNANHDLSVMSPDGENIEMLGLRAEIKLWFDRPFNEYPEKFLEAFDRLTAQFGEQFKWYQNYTMNRFSPVTAKTFTSPKNWLKRGRQDVARMLYLKGPEEMKAAGQYVLWFKYHPDEALYSDTNTPFLKLATPYEFLENNPQDYFEIAKQLCDLLPYLCGHVGYCFETSPYFENQAYKAAFPLGMRHPGANIASDHATWALRDEKGIETVNWLTLVGKLPLAKLNGAQLLRTEFEQIPNIQVIDTFNGIIVKAGEQPELGDTNRNQFIQLYNTVYRTLTPVIDPVISDFSPFLLDDDLHESSEKTQRWLRRFEL